MKRDEDDKDIMFFVSSVYPTNKLVFKNKNIKFLLKISFMLKYNYIK